MVGGWHPKSDSSAYDMSELFLNQNTFFKLRKVKIEIFPDRFLWYRYFVP